MDGGCAGLNECKEEKVAGPAGWLAGWLDRWMAEGKEGCCDWLAGGGIEPSVGLTG